MLACVSVVQLRKLHLLLEVCQQNKDTLHELSQRREGYEGHADRPGLLEALGAWSAPAPEAVAHPAALPRLPASTLEELMAAEEAVQDEAEVAALVFTAFCFIFISRVTAHHHAFCFSVKLCKKA